MIFSEIDMLFLSYIFINILKNKKNCNLFMNKNTYKFKIDFIRIIIYHVSCYLF